MFCYWVHNKLRIVLSAISRIIFKMHRHLVRGVRRWGRIDEVWNLGTMFSQLQACYSAVSSDILRPSSLFLMFCPNFRGLGMFSSSDEVHDVNISWNYILLSVTYNFGLGKWAKIVRNDSKPLCVMTLPVDCIHVQWAHRVSKTIRQNRMGFSYIFSWSCQVWMFTPPFFPNVSTSSL